MRVVPIMALERGVAALTDALEPFPESRAGGVEVARDDGRQRVVDHVAVLSRQGGVDEPIAENVDDGAVAVRRPAGRDFLSRRVDVDSLLVDAFAEGHHVPVGFLIDVDVVRRDDLRTACPEVTARGWVDG